MRHWGGICKPHRSDPASGRNTPRSRSPSVTPEYAGKFGDRENRRAYGVNVLTTVCTALLVPLTTLWPTFLAVCTLLFATFFAVLTGPACIVPTETANARIIENNAFIVLNNSFLRAHMGLPEGRCVAAESLPGWARQDSKLGPRDYESPALTAELQARVNQEFKHSEPCVTNPNALRAYLRLRNFAIVCSSSAADVGFVRYASPHFERASFCESGSA